MQDAQASRYISLLGVAAKPPSEAALAELMVAHLARIPFENVSKLIRHARGEPPVLDGLEPYLDRIEFWNLGGTCHACANHFNGLLRHLGYDARLCGAAMREPDVHAVNVVRLDENEHLVDVGFAAPFFAPLPLDATAPVTIERGPESYVLHPRDPDGHSRLDHLTDGAVVHGYTVDPTARDAAHFASVIADSYGDDSTFLNHLRIVRHTPKRSISLRGFSVTVTDGDTARERTLPTTEALQDVVEVLFGIPGPVIAEALAGLSDS